MKTNERLAAGLACRIAGRRGVPIYYYHERGRHGHQRGAYADIYVIRGPLARLLSRLMTGRTTEALLIVYIGKADTPTSPIKQRISKDMCARGSCRGNPKKRDNNGWPGVIRRYLHRHSAPQFVAHIGDAEDERDLIEAAQREYRKSYKTDKEAVVLVLNARLPADKIRGLRRETLPGYELTKEAFLQAIPELHNEVAKMQAHKDEYRRRETAKKTRG